MKNLKGMKKNFSSLENKRLENMSKIIGGETRTSKGSYQTEDGCTHNWTDTWEDNNGNGRQDWGENFQFTETILCP